MIIHTHMPSLREFLSLNLSFICLAGFIGLVQLWLSVIRQSFTVRTDEPILASATDLLNI